MSFSDDLKKFQALPKDRRIATAAFVLIVFISAVVVAGMTFQRSQTAEQEQAATPEAKLTTIAMTADTVTMNVGATQTVTVAISGTAPTASDVVITYDPTMLAVSNVTNGDVFDRVIQNKIAAGELTFSAALSPDTAANAKIGNVLTFSVRALKNGTAILSFDKQKTVTAVNGENTLSDSTDATIEIQ